MNPSTDNQKFDNSLQFVVRHYREHAFVAPPFSFGSVSTAVWLRRHAVAAVIAAATVIAASACAIYMALRNPETAPLPIETPDTSLHSGVVIDTVKRIEFTDTDLHEVISQIQLTYDVTIVNEPDSTSYRLTLSYEGTADDLIATINGLLDLNLEIIR